MRQEYERLGVSSLLIGIAKDFNDDVRVYGPWQARTSAENFLHNCKVSPSVPILVLMASKSTSIAHMLAEPDCLKPIY